MPTIAILGASANRAKFGNKAVRAYRSQGYDVFPVHPSADVIEGLPVFRSVADVPVAGRTRWVILDEEGGSFYVNIADPPQIAVIDAANPRSVARTYTVPAAGRTPLAVATITSIVHVISA